jgi:hypothetical protein
MALWEDLADGYYTLLVRLPSNFLFRNPAVLVVVFNQPRADRSNLFLLLLDDLLVPGRAVCARIARFDVRLASPIPKQFRQMYCCDFLSSTNLTPEATVNGTAITAMIAVQCSETLLK